MAKAVHTSIIIDAPPKRVWAILMDYDRYPEWNPFVIEIAGEQHLGGLLQIKVQPPGGKPMRFKPTIVEFKENRAFAWLGSVGFKGLFDGRHHFRLSATNSSTTVFEHSERFSGLLTFMFGKKQLENTRRGFEAMNKSLKLLAEVDNPL